MFNFPKLENCYCAPAAVCKISLTEVVITCHCFPIYSLGSGGTWWERLNCAASPSTFSIFIMIHFKEMTQGSEDRCSLMPGSPADRVDTWRWLWWFVWRVGRAPSAGGDTDILPPSVLLLHRFYRGGQGSPAAVVRDKQSGLGSFGVISRVQQPTSWWPVFNTTDGSQHWIVPRNES